MAWKKFSFFRSFFPSLRCVDFAFRASLPSFVCTHDLEYVGVGTLKYVSEVPPGSSFFQLLVFSFLFGFFPHEPAASGSSLIREHM